MEKKEVMITYEALFELLMREKGRESLQLLEEGFYENLALYLREKRVALESVAKPEHYGNEEVERSAKQLQNIYRVVRELFERRERKILNMALVKSRTGSEALDTSALLQEELRLFESASSHLTTSREQLLHSVLESATTRSVALLPLRVKADCRCSTTETDHRKAGPERSGRPPLSRSSPYRHSFGHLQ